MGAMELRPLHNLVWIAVSPESNVLASGLILPENVMQQSCQGRVLAVGPLVSRDLYPGQRVLFEPYQPHVWNDETYEYIVCSDDDVLAEVEDNAVQE